MIAEHNRTSMMYGVPGLILQVAGRIMMAASPDMALLGWVIALAGTALLITGLCYYAMAKGYSAAFGLLGLLSLVGLIILAVMPDKHKPGQVVQQQPSVQPPPYQAPQASQAPSGDTPVER